MSTNSAANYHEKQFFQKTITTYIYLKISLVMNNKSTDIQVYNESKQRSGNLFVYHLKATVVFLYFFFLFTRMKELE